MTEQPEMPDWFRKLTQPVTRKPFVEFKADAEPEPTETSWNAFLAGASPDAPAELPSSQRVAMAQMASQFQEWQRLGFTRLEAFSLVQAQVVTAIQERGRRGRESGS